MIKTGRMFIFTYAICFLLLSLSGCKQGFITAPGEENWTDASLSLLVSRAQILQNGEAWSVITDRQQRMFKVNRPLQVLLKTASTIQITSYCLYPLSDVQIWGRITGYPERIKILTIPLLESLAQNEYTLPLCLSSGSYETESGKHITIAAIEGFSGGMISLEITSTDAVYKSIASVKPSWNIYYGDYDASGTDDSWAPINPLYAREWIALITNFAYSLSSPDFEYVFFNYKDVTGTEFYTDKNDSATFFNFEENYRNLYDRMMTKTGLKLGITTMGGGLGGGDVTGVDTWNFYKHYYDGPGILVHEFGHCMGYSHSSSFCYGEFEGFLADVMGMHIRLGKMPYADEELNGFYRPENAPFRYAEITQNMRKRRKNGNFNSIEKYIMNHPAGAPETAAQLNFFR